MPSRRPGLSPATPGQGGAFGLAGRCAGSAPLTRWSGGLRSEGTPWRGIPVSLMGRPLGYESAQPAHTVRPVSPMSHLTSTPMANRCDRIGGFRPGFQKRRYVLRLWSVQAGVRWLTCSSMRLVTSRPPLISPGTISRGRFSGLPSSVTATRTSLLAKAGEISP